MEMFGERGLGTPRGSNGAQDRGLLGPGGRAIRCSPLVRERLGTLGLRRSCRRPGDEDGRFICPFIRWFYGASKSEGSTCAHEWLTCDVVSTTRGQRHGVHTHPAVYVHMGLMINHVPASNPRQSPNAVPVPLRSNRLGWGRACVNSVESEC